MFPPPQFNIIRVTLAGAVGLTGTTILILLRIQPEPLPDCLILATLTSLLFLLPFAFSR